VILPTFNRLRFLRPAIESVFAQTITDWELIIADDGSGPDTRQYLRSKAIDARVRMIWLPHSGNPAALRNAALREARGEFIAFLDSDDLWMPAKLEVQIAALRSCPHRQWSYTRFIQVNPAGDRINAERSWVDYEGEVFEPVLNLKAVIPTPGVMVTGQLLERAGGFDEHQGLYEDYQLWLRFAMLSEVCLVGEPLVAVRCHDEQFSCHGIGALQARNRMLEKTQAVATCPRHRAALRLARARNAALLAVANAAAGSRSAAVRTVADSWRVSWRYVAWWVGVAKVLAHIYLPSRVKTIVRRFRQAAP
jgi:glycosyltransferase involved in cell wall biosynthesis